MESGHDQYGNSRIDNLYFYSQCKPVRNDGNHDHTGYYGPDSHFRAAGTTLSERNAAGITSNFYQ